MSASSFLGSVRFTLTAKMINFAFINLHQGDMIYNNSAVRRQDRLLDEKKAYELLKKGEYGILSLIDPEGNPYGIPINYVWDENGHIYFHCAPTGKKLSCISAHADVSFCIIGRTNVVPNKFTTGYESIIIKSRARTALPDEEKKHALKLLLEKYAPDNIETGLTYAEKSFHRTEIIRLDLQEFSGKSKIIR